MTYKVYGDHRSGNCYKVKLMLHLLGRAYEWIPVDILRGESREAAFLKAIVFRIADRES